MKRISLLFCSLLLIGATSFAQGEMKERKSPPATAEGMIGEATILIEYSSPRVKDREIYGELVPFDKIWRAGANEATTFEVDQNVTIEGKDLPEGKYALFIIPAQDDAWTVIFNSQSKQWGAYKHDESKDVLRIKAETSEIDATENLTYIVDEDGMIHLDWANTRMSFSVE